MMFHRVSSRLPFGFVIESSTLVDGRFAKQIFLSKLEEHQKKQGPFVFEVHLCTYCDYMIMTYDHHVHFCRYALWSRVPYFKFLYQSQPWNPDSNSPDFLWVFWRLLKDWNSPRWSWWLCQSIFYLDTQYFHMFIDMFITFQGFLFHEFVEGCDDDGQHPVPSHCFIVLQVFLEQRADVNFNQAPAGLTPLSVACLFLRTKVERSGMWPGAPKTLFPNMLNEVTFIFTPNRFSP